MTQSRLLDGKVCLISGAGSGIGRATALAAAREGARLALLGRKRQALEETAQQAGTGDALILTADVTDSAGIAAAVTRIIDHHGQLDCAFNNAGQVLPPTPLVDASEADWRATFEVNLFGLFHAMQAELRVMLAQGSGSIVNMSSVGGLVGSPGNSAYCAAKHGVIGLTKSAALEAGSANVRVNVICPGIVDTEMTAPIKNDPAASAAVARAIPFGRIADAEEISGTALWLMSDKSAFVTGAVIPVDGGYAAV